MPLRDYYPYGQSKLARYRKDYAIYEPYGKDYAIYEPYGQYDSSALHRVIGAVEAYSKLCQARVCSPYQKNDRFRAIEQRTRDVIAALRELADSQEPRVLGGPADEDSSADYSADWLKAEAIAAEQEEERKAELAKIWRESQSRYEQYWKAASPLEVQMRFEKEGWPAFKAPFVQSPSRTCDVSPVYLMGADGIVRDSRNIVVGRIASGGRIVPINYGSAANEPLSEFAARLRELQGQNANSLGGGATLGTLSGYAATPPPNAELREQLAKAIEAGRQLSETQLAKTLEAERAARDSQFQSLRAQISEVDQRTRSASSAATNAQRTADAANGLAATAQQTAARAAGTAAGAERGAISATLSRMEAQLRALETDAATPLRIGKSQTDPAVEAQIAAKNARRSWIGSGLSGLAMIGTLVSAIVLWPRTPELDSYVTNEQFEAYLANGVPLERSDVRVARDEKLPHLYRAYFPNEKGEQVDSGLWERVSRGDWLKASTSGAEAEPDATTARMLEDAWLRMRFEEVLFEEGETPVSTE